MNSIWTQTNQMKSRPSLDGDKKIDVLIVGAGMAGVLCAYFLKQAGVDYMVVEAQKTGMGITKNTTAKITSQHGLIYHNLIKKASSEKASRYLKVNQLALEKFREMCKDIQCDFEEKPAFVYSLTNRQIIEDEVSAIQKLGYQAEFTSTLSLPFEVAGAVKFPGQAQFHPLKFIDAVSKDLKIYENTRVDKIKPCSIPVKGNIAFTTRGNITAKKIIIATHFPFIDLHGFYYLKMYQHRSYVIALEGAGEIDGMYVDEKDKGMSFRNYKELLLVGGGDHRTGKQGGAYQELRNFAAKHYPSAKEKYSWATQDCMPLDNVPYIGRYSKTTPDLYVATGFHKWGMTSAMVSAMLLTDMILGRENRYAEVFSPSRSILKPQLFINAAQATVNLLTPTLKRCTHMGCALKWNKVEKTWDCPCHGSRFEESGEVIDNPAIKDR